MSEANLHWLPPEDRFRIATEAASVGIWEWDVPTGQMEYSPTTRRIFGFPPDGPITIDDFWSILVEEDLQSVKSAAYRALDPKLRERPVYRYRVNRKCDGAERVILAYGEATFGEDDSGKVQPIRYVGTVQDITESARIEEELATSEARLRMAVEAGDIAVWEYNSADNTVLPSPELNRLCGFPEDAEPTLEEYRSRYAPGERERVQGEFAAAMARGETRYQTEIHHIWPDGTEKWLALRAQVVRSSAPGGIRIIGVLSDVTEARRRALEMEHTAQALRHRVKNLITVIGAIAARSWEDSADPVQARREFMARLQALGTATDLILDQPDEMVPLTDVLEATVAPHRRDTNPFRIAGEPVRISQQSVRSVALAVHELCTNAIKYGALSRPKGEVSVHWVTEGENVHLYWRERGGPEIVAPTELGFGLQLVRGLFQGPEGVNLDFEPDGLECRMQVPLV